MPTELKGTCKDNDIGVSICIENCWTRNSWCEPGDNSLPERFPPTSFSPFFSLERRVLRVCKILRFSSLLYFLFSAPSYSHHTPPTPPTPSIPPCNSRLPCLPLMCIGVPIHGRTEPTVDIIPYWLSICHIAAGNLIISSATVVGAILMRRYAAELKKTSLVQHLCTKSFCLFQLRGQTEKNCKVQKAFNKVFYTVL